VVKDSNGVILNVTSYTISSMMRKNYSSSSSSNLTSFIVDASNGVINLTMTAANTTNLIAGRMLYDVLVTSPTSVKTRVVEGIVTILPSITR